MLFCVVVFLGTPEFPKSYRIKGYELVVDKPTRLPADFTTAAKQALGDRLKVVEGTPAPWSPQPAGLKAAARKLNERLEAFPVDPIAALEQVPVLDKDLSALLRGDQAKAVLHVRQGKADASLSIVAIAAKLLGLDKVVEAALEQRARVAKGAEPAAKGEGDGAAKGGEGAPDGSSGPKA